MEIRKIGGSVHYTDLFMYSGIIIHVNISVTKYFAYIVCSTPWTIYYIDYIQCLKWLPFSFKLLYFLDARPSNIPKYNVTFSSKFWCDVHILGVTSGTVSVLCRISMLIPLDALEKSTCLHCSQIQVLIWKQRLWFTRLQIVPLGICINFCIYFFWNENEIEYVPFWAQPVLLLGTFEILANDYNYSQHLTVTLALKTDRPIWMFLGEKS